MAFNDLSKVGITEIQSTVAYLTGKMIDRKKAEIIMMTLDNITTNSDGEEEAPTEEFMRHLQRFYSTETIKMKFDCSMPIESMKKVSDWVDKYGNDLEADNFA